MIEFLTNGNGWLVAGLALIILEIIGSLGYVSISFGLGSIATGLLVKLGIMPTMFASTWADELLVAAICSLLALLALRHFFRRTPSKDINEY